MQKPPLPAFSTDEEAEDFVANSDLTDYDLSGATLVKYEFKPKTANISMRVPQKLLDDVKAEAARHGMPYQRFIRQALEQALAGAGRGKA
jgi:predicted DNA binding CopG/RHH family protein